MLPISLSIALALTPLVAGFAAPKATNPVGAIAVADLPEAGSHKTARGYVVFSVTKPDTVSVHIDMTGLPQAGGPFSYHIHDKPVTPGGGCEMAGKHFDPFDGLLTCPPNGDDAQCQVGDLSGKHGAFNSTCFQNDFSDSFISLDPKSPSYIVGRSVVFHTSDAKVIACATINLATDEQKKNVLDHGTPDAKPRRSGSRSEPTKSASEKTESTRSALKPTTQVQTPQPAVKVTPTATNGTNGTGAMFHSSVASGSTIIHGAIVAIFCCVVATMI